MGWHSPAYGQIPPSLFVSTANLSPMRSGLTR